MIKIPIRAIVFAAILFVPAPLTATAADFKVAFVGDMGVSKRAEEVLKLIKTEGASLVVHAGDMGYANPPSEFERMLNRVLGPGFPVIATVGNHDVDYWDGPGGYREIFERRLMRAGVDWDGVLGERAEVKHRGLSVFMAAPGIFRDGRKGTDVYANYLGERLGKDDSKWRVCLWHKNQARMNVGDKHDETGWAVYEACRRHGALIVTGHSHTYSRTHPLSDMERQTVSAISAEIPVGKGSTIAVVSGLGGNHRDPVEKERLGPWWAAVYADEYGALFCDFGAESSAACYFKDIRGRVIDRFSLRNSLN
jgi:predicted phosphodiesterase